jgi:hypothetical protein
MAPAAGQARLDPGCGGRQNSLDAVSAIRLASCGDGHPGNPVGHKCVAALRPGDRAETSGDRCNKVACERQA